MSTPGRPDDDVDHDDQDQIDVERAPICSACGVTTLAADAFGTGFACDNDECDLYGDLVD